MEHSTEDGSPQIESHAWWLENTHRLHQSQWLQSTMSDLDKRVKKILSLIEDDGDTFAKRAEMFYKKKPLLIECVEDLHRSYKSLAEKYNQLNRSPIFEKPNHFPSKPQGSDHDHDYEHDQDQNSDLDFEFVRFDDCQKGWNELESKVMKLVEDNLEHQAKLVKRNDEKREAINRLRAQLSKLAAENNELKSNIAHTKPPEMKRSRSQILRAKDVILKRIMPESRC